MRWRRRFLRRNRTPCASRGDFDCGARSNHAYCQVACHPGSTMLAFVRQRTEDLLINVAAWQEDKMLQHE